MSRCGEFVKGIESKLGQYDLEDRVFYNGSDKNNNYILAILSCRPISAIHEYLKGNLRFTHKNFYHELSFTQSAPGLDLQYKLDFYEALYKALYHKLKDSLDKEVVLKVPFQDKPWLREMGFGPYEEISFDPESLETIALTMVDEESYQRYLRGHSLSVA